MFPNDWVINIYQQTKTQDYIIITLLVSEIIIIIINNYNMFLYCYNDVNNNNDSLNFWIIIIIIIWLDGWLVVVVWNLNSILFSLRRNFRYMYILLTTLHKQITNILCEIA